MLVLLTGLISLVLASAQEDGRNAEILAQDGGRAITSTVVNQRAASLCLNGMVRFNNVRLLCRIDGEGRPGQCEIIDPTPALQRRERVFQCMAAQMRFTYEDGAPATGEEVEVVLGGQTTLTEDEYQRLRQEERRDRRTP